MNLWVSACRAHDASKFSRAIGRSEVEFLSRSSVQESKTVKCAWHALSHTLSMNFGVSACRAHDASKINRAIEKSQVESKFSRGIRNSEVRVARTFAKIGCESLG